MREIKFEAQVGPDNKIEIPAEYAQEVPKDKRVVVEIVIDQPPAERRTNGALEYYMNHPIEMEGVLPWNREDLYKDILGE